VARKDNTRIRVYTTTFITVLRERERERERRIQIDNIKAT
jgi:hypothetical protein